MRAPMIGLIAVLFLVGKVNAQESSTLQMPAGEVIKEATKEVAEENAKAPTESGVQSLYMQLPGDGQALADISFAAGSVISNQSDINGLLSEQNTQYSTYDFNYLYGFSDSFQIGFGAGFIKSSSSNNDGTGGGANVGMRDFGVTVQKSVKEENHTLIYGLASLLSPEPSAAVSKGTTGSNFSGATTLSPFAAYQTRLTRGVLGAKLAANFFLRQESYDSGGYISNSGTKKWNFDLTGFYEFPIHRVVKFGLALNLENDDSILQNAGTYSGELYCGIKVLDDTLVRVSASGFSYSQGSNNLSGTQVSLGLRTAL